MFSSDACVFYISASSGIAPGKQTKSVPGVWWSVDQCHVDCQHIKTYFDISFLPRFLVLATRYTLWNNKTTEMKCMIHFRRANVNQSTRGSRSSFFFFRLLPSGVATAEFPSPFGPIFCILVRQFQHVLSHRINILPYNAYHASSFLRIILPIYSSSFLRTCPNHIIPDRAQNKAVRQRSDLLFIETSFWVEESPCAVRTNTAGLDRLCTLFVLSTLLVFEHTHAVLSSTLVLCCTMVTTSTAAMSNSRYADTDRMKNVFLIRFSKPHLDRAKAGR